MTNEEQTISNLKKLKSFHNGSYGADIDRAIKALEQEPKTGHWIKKDGYSDCSECGSHIVTEWDYCPKCGAKMIEPQKSEVQE